MKTEQELAENIMSKGEKANTSLQIGKDFVILM